MVLDSREAETTVRWERRSRTAEREADARCFATHQEAGWVTCKAVTAGRKLQIWGGARIGQPRHQCGWTNDALPDPVREVPSLLSRYQ